MNDYAAEQASEVEALDSIYYTDMKSMYSPASPAWPEQPFLYFNGNYLCGLQ